MWFGVLEVTAESSGSLEAKKAARSEKITAESSGSQESRKAARSESWSVEPPQRGAFPKSGSSARMSDQLSSGGTPTPGESPRTVGPTGEEPARGSTRDDFLSARENW